MLITLTSDYVYVLAMLKTTPLVVTVGLSLTIPLAVLGDFLLGKVAHRQAILGAVLVLAAFIIIGVENSKSRDKGADLLDDRVNEGGEGEGELCPSETILEPLARP
jgi:solute carrier family 35 protein F5